MKRYVISLAIGSALVLSGLAVSRFYSPTTVAIQSVASSSPDIYDLWQLTNQERQKAGVTAVVLDPALDTTASAKCTDMSTKHYWSHDAPDGHSWQSFLTPINYLAAAENLAASEPDSQTTIDAWMHSPEHRENLLNPVYTNVGFAVCNDSKLGTIVVQHFTDMQP